MRTQLKKHRQAQGVTVERLAEVLGVKPRTVNLWQAGSAFPQPKNVKRLEAMLGKPIDVLLAPENAKGPAATESDGAGVAVGDSANVCHPE